MEHRPPHPGRILNTWVGDPHKIILLEQVVKTIKEDNLLELTRRSGEVMMDGLKGLEKQFPGLLTKVRGRGTFCAVDLPNVQIRDKFLVDCRSNGVHLGGCGESSIRFRPSLTFTPEEANMMLEVMQSVLNKY